MKISVKVPLIASAIVIAAFAVFSFYQYRMVSTSMYQTLENNVDETCQALSHQISNWLNGKLSVVNMMAQVVEAEYSPEMIQRVIKTPMLNDGFILAYHGRESDGIFESNSLTWSPPDGWDPRVRPWYQLAKSTGTHAVITEPYLDVKTKEMIVSMAEALRDGNRFKGVIACDLSLKTVSDAVNTLNFNNTGYAFITNSAGMIISHPDKSLNGQTLNALFTQEVPALDSSIKEEILKGRQVFVKFTPLTGLSSRQWFIGVVLDKEKSMAEADVLKLRAIIGMIAAGLISSLALYLTMAQLLLKPIKSLIATADEISRGKLDFEIKETRRKDEIGALAKAFERMGVSIRLAMTRLQKKR